jgi:hypothetical protein
MTIDGRDHASLMTYFKKLPNPVRIACHPCDGDDVPFWTGKPTSGGYESMLPWFVDSWKRQKAMTKDVLQALYADNWETVRSFCSRYKVTHLLLRKDRYGPKFREKSRMVEPFGSFLLDLLRPLDRDDLVLLEGIQSKAAFRDGPYVVIEVKSLFDPARD